MNATLHEGFTPGCLGRITELHATTYAALAGFGLGFEALVARDLADFADRFEPGRDGLWLVTAGPQQPVQGSVAIDGTHARAPGGAAHLRWFITSDALRGQGLGRALLARALAFCDARAYPEVALWTFAGLDAARHLYEAHGFRLAEQAEGTRWGGRVTEQRFVRRRA